MTFSQQVKDEIFHGKPLSGKERGFFSYGLLSCSTIYSSTRLEMNTESISYSKLYCFAVGNILKRKIMPVEGISIRGIKSYTLTIDDIEDVEKIHRYFDGTIASLVESELGRGAFLSGAFLACGTVNDPQKEYHFELYPPTDATSDLLFLILAQMGYPPKAVERGSRSSLYFKESEQIEDLLNIVGATNCGFQLMEAKIYKEVRNKSNRISNCDTANIDKIVDAAQAQIADIEYLFTAGKENLLSPPLKEMAVLRLEHPEASLRELAELLGISRSGANHRLKKIAEIAKLERLEE